MRTIARPQKKTTQPPRVQLIQFMQRRPSFKGLRKLEQELFFAYALDGPDGLARKINEFGIRTDFESTSPRYANARLVEGITNRFNGLSKNEKFMRLVKEARAASVTQHA